MLIFFPENKSNEVLMLLQTAKKLKREDVDIRYTLAILLSKNERLDEAIREMEDLLRIKELDEYFKTYVNMLFAARRYDIIQSVVKNKRKKRSRECLFIDDFSKSSSER